MYNGIPMCYGVWINYVYSITLSEEETQEPNELLQEGRKEKNACVNEREMDVNYRLTNVRHTIIDYKK